jgi:lipid-binding SYLF domain-containing protein
MEESMRTSIRECAFLALGVLLALSLTSSAVLAQKNGKRADDAARHASEAAKVFDEIMATPDKAIPRELIDKAEAIAVFPGTLKAAFIFGGRGGQGVVSRRTARGWSAPAFYNLGGGSFGAQIGAEKTDVVLLIMNEDGLKGLMSDKFELGAEAGVAAGPVGRTAAASTDVKLQAGILSYSRSKGAFIGVSLKGTFITPDDDLNQAFYGRKAAEIVTSPITPPPPTVRTFPQTLAKY